VPGPDRSLIGRRAEPTTITIDASAIPAFARAIGEDNPMYLSAEAARAAGYANVVAPPTYPIAFMAESMNADLFFDLNLNIPSLVHGEQEFEYFRPVVGGETLHVQGCVADIWEKAGRSGVLDFVVMEAAASDAEGKPVYTSRITLISKRVAAFDEPTATEVP
jgi:acyl dehydratase